MSEEEKAIETLKEVASDDFDTLGDDISPKMAQNILNVIEKQQKEIKEGYHKGFTDGRISMKYEVQDKIREKLKELEEQFKKYENEGLSGFVSKIDKGTRIEVLKELLEEK